MNSAKRLLRAGRRYVGPGDVIGSAIAWGSVARAYNAAFAASRAPMMDLVDTATGLITTTVRVRSNGFVDLSTIPAYGCSVKTLYDQTGNGNHFTQATLANMPVLTLNSLNRLPGMTLSGGSMALTTAGAVAQSQPFSYSSVAVRTNTLSAFIMESTGTFVGLGYSGGANLAQSAATSVLTATASDNSYHALQGVINGASSATVVDGAATTGALNAGTAAAGSLQIGGANTGNVLTGTVLEAGIWAVAFSASQYAAMNANQHSGYGYSF